jgi:hypothetical protein
MKTPNGDAREPGDEVHRTERDDWQKSQPQQSMKVICLTHRGIRPFIALQPPGDDVAADRPGDGVADHRTDHRPDPAQGTAHQGAEQRSRSDREWKSGNPTDVPNA